MSLTAVVGLGVIVVVAVVSTVIGAFGVRFARTTSDFLVASRTVGPGWNASAISGEFLSVSSVLGIAGLILKDGPDALWYSLGPVAGYLALLLFVAAPLRRSGAYTVPDFAEFRLRSAGVQRVCTLCVLVIGWLYLLPQLQGAGLIAAAVVPSLPAWSGMITAALVVTATVVFGGMRSITFVQGFQYWLKLTALAVPTMVLLIHVGGAHVPLVQPLDQPLNQPLPPQFRAETTVTVHTDVVLRVSQPVSFTARGVLDDRVIDGPLRWAPGAHTVRSGAALRFGAGSAVPTPAGAPARNSDWLTPLSGGGDHRLFGLYSLILAEFLGTMGLPHVLVRFYTNPDGRAARRTAVVVLALLGVFYLFPVLLGALSRWYVPQLLVNGDTDAAVLLLPAAALGNSTTAMLLGALVGAGAWAALLSTSSGLLISLAGVISTSPNLFPRARVQDFRLAAVLAVIAPLALALIAARLDFSQTVVLAFAVSASTLCPLLLLGIWWPRLTDRGAIAGVCVGGLLSIAAVGSTVAGLVPAGWLSVLLARPAAATVPAAFLTMIIVSKATPTRLLPDVPMLMLQLHAPEWLTPSHDRATDLPHHPQPPTGKHHTPPPTRATATPTAQPDLKGAHNHPPGP